MNAVINPLRPRDLTGARWARAGPRYELIPIGGMRGQAAALPTGATVTVTCSPKHGLERTLEAAEWFAGLGFRVVPHIAARLVRDTGHLRETLLRLRGAGLAEVFLVGGDAPRPVGRFADGLSLLRVMADLPERPVSIGVPAYPEGHASIPDAVLRAALAEKVRLADYMVSQLCFDPVRMLAWIRETREAGITLPLYVGLPGAVDTAKLMRIAMAIGLGASTRMLRKQRGLIGRLRQGSEYSADDLVHGIVETFSEPGLAVRGVHINTFNNVAATAAWRDALLARMQPACADEPAGRAIQGPFGDEPNCLPGA